MDRGERRASPARRGRLIAFTALAAGMGGLTAAAWITYGREVAAGAARGERGGEVWGAGYFPNVSLVTHEGEEVRFFDDVIAGKVVAINFIYTWCPDTCPVETARLLQVARLLGDRLGRDVFFYSITIDPGHDTQPVLKAFTESWAIPDGWTFLTGKAADIALLRQRLGMRLDDVKTGDLSDHSVNLLIGNQKTGRWMKRSPFENPYVLATQLGSWLHGWKLASETTRDYAEAPELRAISDGEYIFRNLCSACHTIGRGDVMAPAEERVGPDLYNVTQRRERRWLERWLSEPDKMLEEGDPLATTLLEAYDEMPMPNLRLTERDVAALLGYIDQESRQIGAQRASGGHRGHSAHADHAPQTRRAGAAAADRLDGHAGHAEGGAPGAL